MFVVPDNRAGKAGPGNFGVFAEQFPAMDVQTLKSLTVETSISEGALPESKTADDRRRAGKSSRETFEASTEQGITEGRLTSIPNTQVSKNRPPGTVRFYGNEASVPKYDVQRQTLTLTLPLMVS